MPCKHCNGSLICGGEGSADKQVGISSDALKKILWHNYVIAKLTINFKSGF